MTMYELTYLGPGDVCTDPETGLTWARGGRQVFNGDDWVQEPATVHEVGKADMERLVEDNPTGWLVEKAASPSKTDKAPAPEPVDPDPEQPAPEE
jgi:hypothetical protein